MKEGIVTKGIGGFYYVSSDETVFVCRAAGAIKQKKIKLAVGDRVKFENEEHGDYLITEILPRENLILRPHCANVTQNVIVCAAKEPKLEYVLLDKLIIDGMLKNTNNILCVTKTDLISGEEMEFIVRNYAPTVTTIVFTSALKNIGIDDMREVLKNKVSLFRGVSGAGKTSLLNALAPGLERETGELSRKIARGKNTTRHSELTKLCESTFVLDTPGFSDFDVPLDDECELWKYYPEFFDFSDCRYVNCMHINEPECGVKTAVEEGKISGIRYENYKKIYNDVKKSRRY